MGEAEAILPLLRGRDELRGEVGLGGVGRREGGHGRDGGVIAPGQRFRGVVAGGEITKAARNWLGSKLDAAKRNQIIFMDRDDILNLFVVTNMPLPAKALPPPCADLDDEIPF